MNDECSKRWETKFKDQKVISIAFELKDNRAIPVIDENPQITTAPFQLQFRFRSRRGTLQIDAAQLSQTPRVERIS